MPSRQFSRLRASPLLPFVTPACAPVVYEWICLRAVCLEMPHLMHMLVSLVIAVLFLTVTALMVIASSDLNPASLALLSTPASTVRLKILAAKAAYIVTANCLDSIPKIQSVLLAITVVLIVYWNLRAVGRAVGKGKQRSVLEQLEGRERV